MSPKHLQGFSLAEALVSITLLGVLATILMPMLYNNVGNDKLYHASIEGIAEIALAYSKYQKQNMPDANTTATAILLNMNYVRLINNGVMSVQLNGNDYACNNVTPCYLLHNGALVMFDADERFGGTGFNTNALHFILDPDADGPNNGISLLMYFNGSFSTERYRKPGTAAIPNDDLPSSINDPEYIWSWTEG